MRGMRIVDWIALVPFFAAYPVWVRLMIATWLVLTTAIAIALMFAPHHKVAVSGARDQVMSPVKPPEVFSVDEGADPPSLEGYFSTMAQLEGRFYERDNFPKTLMGKTVSWEGYVASVSATSGTTAGMSHVLILNVSRDWGAKNTMVFYPSDFSTRLYSLRKDDKVRIIGTFDGTMAGTPGVKGTSLELIPEPSE